MTVTEAKPATEVFHERPNCRNCWNASLELVLDLGNQYLPRFVPEKDETLPRAPLQLVRCSHCGLLQLGHTTNPDLLFRQFWYRTGMNDTMKSAMKDLVQAGLSHHRGGVWLDIGANDGYLLSQVPREFQKVAVEPAENFKSELEDIADQVITGYFQTKAGLKRSCDIITSAAMFYDLDDPHGFLDSIVECLHPRGVWINQLNDSPTMLKMNAFDSICHEHLTYYDVPTLSEMYLKHGLTIIGISHNQVNGGSVRIVAKKSNTETKPADLSGLPGATSKSFSNDIEDFQNRIPRWREKILQILPEDAWVYGASTKGLVLTQYLDCQFVAAVEKNPDKVGLKMAGTWTPIVSEDEFRNANPRCTVVLPWAFRSEFLSRERAYLNAGGSLVMPLPNIEVCL
jgi:NDP-4-keto-2,6-dideoxyhexose 3-C-methyltransferase